MGIFYFALFSSLGGKVKFANIKRVCQKTGKGTESTGTRSLLLLLIVSEKSSFKGTIKQTSSRQFQRLQFLSNLMLNLSVNNVVFTLKISPFLPQKCVLVHFRRSSLQGV